jgi:hypothetical protein
MDVLWFLVPLAILIFGSVFISQQDKKSHYQ